MFKYLLYIPSAKLSPQWEGEKTPITPEIRVSYRNDHSDEHHGPGVPAVRASFVCSCRARCWQVRLLGSRTTAPMINCTSLSAASAVNHPVKQISGRGTYEAAALRKVLTVKVSAWGSTFARVHSLPSLRDIFTAWCPPKLECHTVTCTAVPKYRQ